MHVGLVASRTTVVELHQAFAEILPHLEEVDSADLATVNDLWRWMDAHRKFVSAAEWRPDNRGTEVIAFWQDGPWAVFTDGSYVLPSDDERLASLSTRFPTVLSFIVESAGGDGLERRGDLLSCEREVGLESARRRGQEPGGAEGILRRPFSRRPGFARRAS
jgi:hypothetical protein